MADLNIRYGLSSELFIDGQVNPKLIIEANCWYLCTDTAELFLGTYEECDSCANCTHCDNCTNCTNCDNCSDRKLILKKVNSTKLDQVAACIVKLEIIDGNLIATYSDDTVVDLGKTVDYIPTKVSEFVNDAGYITAADIPTTDLSSYAKKSDIPDVSKFITSIPDEYVTESELADLKYATEQYVIDAIANQVPVSDLAKKEEVEEVKTKLEAEVLPTIKETILPTVQELAEKAATQEWVQEQGYLTEHQDLSEYAKKSELPVVDGLASEEFVIKKIAEAELADQDVDLSAYYTKSETETAINAAISAIETPEVPTKVSELENDAGYITKVSPIVYQYKLPYPLDTNLDLGLDSTLVEFADRFIQGDNVVLYVYWEGQLFTTHVHYHKSNINGVDIDDLHIEYQHIGHGNSGELSNEGVGVVTDTIWLRKNDTNTAWKFARFNASQNAYDFLPNFETVRKLITTAITDIPATDLSNYYNKTETENLIAEAVESIEHPTVDLDGYATEEWVNEQGYLTEHQDLSEYAKKTELFSKSYKDLVDTPEIPSIDGLASEEYVDNAIANIDIPEVDLTNVYTKNETDSVIASAISNIKHPTPDLTAYALKSDLEIKADDIPFATNRYVSNAIGNFVAGESVRGLTIAEILAKLLGLSDVPQGVVDDIIVNKYGLYQFNDSIETEKIEFTLTEFNTAEEYAGAPDKTTFYQYTYTNDEGKKVTESGYQHYTLAQDFIWYMVMLPSSLVIGENVKVQAWADEPRNMWVDTITTLESDLDVIAANFAEVGLELPEIPEGYTMWVDFSNTNPGNIVRYIIIE